MALRVPEDSYASVADVERRVQQLFVCRPILDDEGNAFELDDECKAINSDGDPVPESEQHPIESEELFRDDIETFLRAGKKWIDGQLSSRGAPFGEVEGEDLDALELVRPINADYAAERAFPPYLTDSDLNRNRVTSKWRENLKAIKEGRVDLDLTDDASGGEFLGYTGGRSYSG